METINPFVAKLYCDDKEFGTVELVDCDNDVSQYLIWDDILFVRAGSTRRYNEVEYWPIEEDEFLKGPEYG